MQIEVKTLKIEYHFEAKNGTPIVFINSLGSDYSIWDDVVSQLLPFMALRYDQRGHGGSSVPTGAYSVNQLSTDLHDLLKALELEKVVLVGISVGGQVALEFAARFPQMVEAAVFCDTGLKIGTNQLWDARIKAVRENGLKSISATVMERWFTPNFRQAQPEFVANCQAMLERTSEIGYVATCQALRDADLTVAAEQIRVSGIPTLVVCGAEDSSTPLALSQTLATALHTQLEVIADSGHLPCLDNPLALVAVLRRFLEQEAV